MMRSVFIAASRGIVRSTIQRPATVTRFVAPAFNNSSTLRSQWALPSIAAQAVRCYSAHAGLAEEEVTGRILDLLKNFDKVTDLAKLNPKSHFSNDLGLDSLDTVEVVMAIEEEFSIEIPDKDADAIHSVDQAVQYIVSQPDAH